MKIVALILGTSGLIISGFTLPIVIYGSGPILLGIGYCLYVHSLVKKT